MKVRKFFNNLKEVWFWDCLVDYSNRVIFVNRLHTKSRRQENFQICLDLGGDLLVANLSMQFKWLRSEFDSERERCSKYLHMGIMRCFRHYRALVSKTMRKFLVIL